MQNVIDRARIPLNDEDKDRYSDVDLLAYANAGLRRAFALRPDLRLGQYATSFSDLPLSGTFPIADRYQQLIADYAAARAETRDSEHVSTGRVGLFMQNFEKELLA